MQWMVFWIPGLKTELKIWNAFTERAAKVAEQQERERAAQQQQPSASPRAGTPVGALMGWCHHQHQWGCSISSWHLLQVKTGAKTIFFHFKKFLHFFFSKRSRPQSVAFSHDRFKVSSHPCCPVLLFPYRQCLFSIPKWAMGPALASGR